MVGNTTIKRFHTGTQWAEGPAWNGVGRYMVWSDIPNNVQLRWIEDDGRVTVFRNPSGYSNGNTFDFEGRQLSCEHGGRRVVATSPTAPSQSSPKNSRASASTRPTTSSSTRRLHLVHRPSYGINSNYEGFKADKELKEAVYRIDKSGQMDKISDEMNGPNGICFSPDYRRSTSPTPAPAARSGSGTSTARPPAMASRSRSSQSRLRSALRRRRHPLRRGRQYLVRRASRRPDLAPTAEPIGMIRLPENCANICFGGAKANRLFMAASQVAVLGLRQRDGSAHRLMRIFLLLATAAIAAAQTTGSPPGGQSRRAAPR